MEDIIAVARKANIHQFITNLPQVGLCKFLRSDIDNEKRFSKG